jgi:hypothetical protein
MRQYRLDDATLINFDQITAFLAWGHFRTNGPWTIRLADRQE